VKTLRRSLWLVSLQAAALRACARAGLLARTEVVVCEWSRDADGDHDVTIELRCLRVPATLTGTVELI
jgi:hypothetical protein